MALIVEFELRTPILQTAAEAIRRIELEEVYRTESDEAKLLFWAFADGFEPFDAALADDSSIATYTVLDEVADRQLYSVVLSDRAADRLTYPVAAEHDVTILEIVVTTETLVRARVPSRESLYAYRDRCLEKGVGFHLRRLYHEYETEGDQYGVTDRQQEALLSAFDEGYFEVPRGTTLSTLAEEFEISDQALSARLRRGQANLLRHTLVDDPS
ncbi:bacterio-opsin activator [Natronorubrum sp. JWXQ-INN-674]|uniref:Bacterio-opsin activator n=1 Tax=Natronorubrum halalkaliphilum TaxID=2691917 RepID=A0A6B0VNX7_9EURY|nr:helix-turn-helix domain-containing protein [Natronorubrum halalkaliphilum]MXV62472.1 bacterio-opsin activator [Natronorubrum halalkaliphilum]